MFDMIITTQDHKHDRSCGCEWSSVGWLRSPGKNEDRPEQNDGTAAAQAGQEARSSQVPLGLVCWLLKYIEFIDSV